MTELERARRMLAKCEAQAQATKDPATRYYYEQCAAGWRRAIENVEQTRSK